MLPPLCLRPEAHHAVLDLCAPVGPAPAPRPPPTLSHTPRHGQRRPIVCRRHSAALILDFPAPPPVPFRSPYIRDIPLSTAPPSPGSPAAPGSKSLQCADLLTAAAAAAGPSHAAAAASGVVVANDVDHRKCTQVLPGRLTRGTPGPPPPGIRGGHPHPPASPSLIPPPYPSHGPSHAPAPLPKRTEAEAALLPAGAAEGISGSSPCGASPWSSPGVPCAKRAHSANVVVTPTQPRNHRLPRKVKPGDPGAMEGGTSEPPGGPENDTCTPLRHSEYLFDNLPGSDGRLCGGDGARGAVPGVRGRGAAAVLRAGPVRRAGRGLAWAADGLTPSRVSAMQGKALAPL